MGFTNENDRTEYFQEYQVFWGTKVEKKFLDQLGTFHKDERKRTPARRLQLLKNYVETADLREDWSDINKKQIIFYANKLIREAQ